MDQSLRYKALRAANIASFASKNNWGGADEERRLLKEHYCKNKSVSPKVASQTLKEVSGVHEARVGVVGNDEGNVDHENKEDHEEKEDHEDNENNEDNERQQNGNKNSSALIEPVHEPAAVVFRSKV